MARDEEVVSCHRISLRLGSRQPYLLEGRVWATSGPCAYKIRLPNGRRTGGEREARRDHTTPPPLMFVFAMMGTLTSPHDGLQHDIHGWLKHDASWECSSQCAHNECTSHTIQYGNFCGAVHSGCEGVEPCDRYDECCKVHNACVDESDAGVADQACHDQLLSCLDTVLEAGAETWIEASLRMASNEKDLSVARSTCNATTVVRSLNEAMRIATIFSSDHPSPSVALAADSIDEETWRADIAAGRRRYNAEEHAAFHSRQLKGEADNDPKLVPIGQALPDWGNTLTTGPGTGAPPAPPNILGGKGRTVPLPNGEHMYYKQKEKGGFRMVFMPPKDPNYPVYSVEEDAARQRAKLAAAHTAKRMSGSDPREL